MTQYKFNVGGTQSVIGNLTWNANGTLASLGITNPFNAADTQTCTYGYDDLVRVTKSNCGTIWSQTFGSDPFGNLTKSGSVSFQPTYNQSTNRYSALPGFTPTYDANGNLKSDSFHTYTWDAENRPYTYDSGTSATTVTYDALAREVEFSTSSGNTEVLYGPTGTKVATASGTTLYHGYVPLPAGAVALYVGGTTPALSRYRHPDWLGNDRFSSTTTRTMYASTAYAPYGETYARSAFDVSFTGKDADTKSDLYDFLFRQYHYNQGRWISPDPAGIGAVDLGNPQSWNRYAYVGNNPITAIDSLGLFRSDAISMGVDSSCSINGFVASCGMVMSFANAGGGGEFGVLCSGNCEAFNSGQLRIGADNRIYKDGEFDDPLSPSAVDELTSSGNFAFASNSDSGQSGGGSANCTNKALNRQFGVTFTRTSNLAAVGGHNNTLFSASNVPVTTSVTIANMLIASEGFGTGYRFGFVPSLHVTNVGFLGPGGSSVTIQMAAHIDLGNPNSGLAGLLIHGGADYVGGQVAQRVFSRRIDVGCR